MQECICRAEKDNALGRTQPNNSIKNPGHHQLRSASLETTVKTARLLVQNDTAVLNHSNSSEFSSQLHGGTQMKVPM